MNKIIISFNKVNQFGNELSSIKNILNTGYTILNDDILKKNKDFFYKRYNFTHDIQFFTHTCSAALEMIALACDITNDDEVIVPTYTFVTSVSSFVLRGAKIVFVDSNNNNPNLDCDKIEKLIKKKTKVIVCVHYAGIPCDIDKLLYICNKYNIILVEDSAQSINSFYKGKPLGSFGSFSTFSFHETKNIQCGEGGLLIVNNKKFLKKINLIYEKGTNRYDFKNGLIDKYSWYELGSSFSMSGIISAYLNSQLVNFDIIMKRRSEIWNKYFSLLNNNTIKYKFKLQHNKNHNYHMFYIIGTNRKYVDDIINILKKNGILACRHYISLHDSPYIKNNYKKSDIIYSKNYENDIVDMINSKNYENNLLRLPLYYELENKSIDTICKIITKYCENNI